jgi:transposase
MLSKTSFIKLLVLKKNWGYPKRLSLDEFARKKGQGNFATILTDLNKSSLLEVIDSHKSDDIITILKQQPLAMREVVEEVCVDMWGGFPKVIREVFPNAKPVIDRFHVQKLVNKAAHRPGGFLQVVCDKTALNKTCLSFLS